MDTKKRETPRETDTESKAAKLRRESLHKCDFANASYFFQHPNQQVTNITKAIFVKTANCITTNPRKSIRRVTGATISVNVNFTGTKQTKRSEPLCPWIENVPPPNLGCQTLKM